MPNFCKPARALQAMPTRRVLGGKSRARLKLLFTYPLAVPQDVWPGPGHCSSGHIHGRRGRLGTGSRGRGMMPLEKASVFCQVSKLLVEQCRQELALLRK